MTQQTKTTLAISATYCVLFITALASMVFVVHEQGAKLEAAKIAIAEHAAKEAAYNNVMRLLETSASNRAELKSYQHIHTDGFTQSPGRRTHTHDCRHVAGWVAEHSVPDQLRAAGWRGR